MQAAPIPPNEKERLDAVYKLGLLGTKPEARFDVLTREAVAKLQVPMSMISILDADKEWYKSCIGFDEKEGARDTSFCGHALLADNVFVIEDTLKDARFADNPMVIGAPFIRFYAGIALLDVESGQPVAVFCIKDTKPRSLSLDEMGIFMDIAGRVEKELNSQH